MIVIFSYVCCNKSSAVGFSGKQNESFDVRNKFNLHPRWMSVQIKEKEINGG